MSTDADVASPTRKPVEENATAGNARVMTTSKVRMARCKTALA